MKEISVIVACRNSEKYLDRCIGSILNQTLGRERMEIIFVYDKSDDQTLPILLSYERRYPDAILVVQNEERVSIGHARNVGLSYASGRYVGFVDSDDYIEPAMFERMCGEAEEHGCDMAECGYVREIGEEPQNIIPGDGRDALLEIGDAAARKVFVLNRLNHVTCWERIYRRDFLIENGISFSEEGAPEDEYFTAILLFYVRRCYSLHEPYYHYTCAENENSASRDRRLNQAAGKMDMEFKILEEAGRRGFLGEYRDVLEYRFIQKYYVESLLTAVRFYLPGDEDKLRLIAVMRVMTERAYPGWRENPYLNLPQTENVRQILRTVEADAGELSVLRLQAALYPERAVETRRFLEERLAALEDGQRWQEAAALFGVYYALLKPADYTDTSAVLGAALYIGLGQYDQALAHCVGGLYVNLENCRLYQLMGRAYAGKGMEERAYLCLENAVFLCRDEDGRSLLEAELTDYAVGGEEIRRPSKAAFVILNYNGLEETRECIKSIRQYCPGDAYELIVIDNGSQDGSAEWLRAHGDERMRLILNEENLGFPAGCNQGIRAADPLSDIFLLNNDTLMMRNTLFNMRMALYERESVGAVGAVSNSVHYYQEIVKKYDTVEEYFEHARVYNVPDDTKHEERIKLIGFAMLIKREALLKTGLLDERFTPGNGEDDDLSLRILKAGYENILCKDAFLFHWGGKSFGKDKRKFEELIGRNKRKLHEKYGFPVTEYSYIHFDALKEIDRDREEEFSVLEIGCGLGADLLRLRQDYPRAHVLGLEESPRAAALAALRSDVAAGGMEMLEKLCPPDGFDYVIRIYRGGVEDRDADLEANREADLQADGKAEDFGVWEKEIRPFLKDGGRGILVEEKFLD